MSTITTRSGKGSPLTNNEIDDNFTNLNTDKYQSGDTPTFAGLTTTADVRFLDSDSSNFVAFQAPATVSSNVTWTLPGADAGTSGYALVSDGSGTLSWAAAGATISQDEATNTNFNLYFASTTSGALTAVNYDSGLSYNPSTGTLTSSVVDATTLKIGSTSVTATATELNILDGVTSTAAELNILDGVTATAAELNYNDITTLGQVEASKTVTANASGNVKWGDSQLINIGDSNDLQIYHDGSNSYIDDNGTGNLNIRAINLVLGKSGTAETMIEAVADGAVTLYYDNAATLTTTSTGVDVTGDISAENLSINNVANVFSLASTGDITSGQTISAPSIDATSSLGGYNLYVGDSLYPTPAGHYTGIWFDAGLSEGYFAGSWMFSDSTNISATGNEYLKINWFGSTDIEASVGAFNIGGISGGSTTLNVTGTVTATGDVIAYYSDDRLKNNLGKIENALEKVESLEGFYYEANEKAQELGYEVKREVGISAQSVEKVMPEVVAPAPIDEQYLTVKYERLVPLLIESIKELSVEVKELRAEVKELKG